MPIIDSFDAEIKDSVKRALLEMGIPDIEFDTEIPSVEDVDLAIPCFSMSKVLGKKPDDIAKKIAENVKPGGLIGSVSASGGYVNFSVNEGVLISSTIRDIIEMGDTYGSCPPKGKKINVEHTSTNPTGPIHVGRARNPIIGDTLARILKMCGYDVSTEYYVNDVGKQVVILTWGINNLREGVHSEVASPEVAEDHRNKIDHKLVSLYRAANTIVEKDPVVREEIAEMLRRFEAGEEEITSSVHKTAEIMLDGLRETLANINVFLDTYTWESDFIRNGSAKAIVETLKKSVHAEKIDGAWSIDLKNFGIRGRSTKFIFLRSDGTTLYTTRDLAYHLDKFRRADELIDVLGEDQKLGSKQLCSVLKILGSKRIPESLFYAFVNLPQGRMSTRRGIVVYLDDLIDESISRAYAEVKLRHPDMSDEKIKEISRVIGVGAIRYNIIRVQPEKQFTFKWDEALNFDGNSGPFLQYSYARACSILKRAGRFNDVVDASKLVDRYEIRLIKILSKFGSIVKLAGESRRIHLLPTYGHEIASAFNQFYVTVPVISSIEKRDARLTLVKCFKIVLKNVLTCLGMGAPEEM